MTAISNGIGSGAVAEMNLADVINEPWCEFLTMDIKLQTSSCLAE